MTLAADLNNKKMKEEGSFLSHLCAGGFLSLIYNFFHRVDFIDMELESLPEKQTCMLSFLFPLPLSPVPFLLYSSLDISSFLFSFSLLSGSKQTRSR